MRHRFALFICGLIWLVTRGGSLLAEDLSWTPMGTWPSPQGTYVATLESRTGMGRLIVKPIKNDKTIIPLTEQFDMAPSGSLNPPAQGLWSPQEDKFSVYFATNEIYGSGKCWLRGKLVELESRPPGFPGDKVLPQFNVTKTFEPDLSLENLVDRIGDLHPKYSGLLDQVYGFEKVQWVGSVQIQAEAIFGMQVRHEGSQKVINYKADWPVTYQISTDGFKTVESVAIHLVEIDPETKAETTVKLPENSPTEKLRVAVRQGDLDRVNELLAQGANPTPESAGQSPLLIAVMKKNVGMIDAMLAAGGKVEDDIVSAALENYDPAIVDKIFAASPKLTEEEVYWEYSILLFGPPQGVKTAEQWHGIFDYVTDLYLKLGANINARDTKTGDTILMEAVNKRAPVGFIEKLVKSGADPSLKNKMGETAVDMAARKLQLPALRFLDTQGKYADLIKQYAISTDSSFLGSWTQGGYIALLKLNPDGTGIFSSMFGGNVTWKQTGKTAEIQIHIIDGQGQEKIFRGDAHLSDDQKTLHYKLTQDPTSSDPAREPEWVFDKGVGDFGH